MFGVTILGNNSALPAYDRHPTAQVVTLNQHQFLIDCGEGTQMQLSRYKVRRSRINHIFISHLHGDHYFGLPGLITSMGLLNREHELHVHGPAFLKGIIDIILQAADTRLPYQLHFHPLVHEGTIVDDEKFSIDCFKVFHRIECWGFVIREKKNLRRINKDTINLYAIPTSFYDQLKLGEDYYNGEYVVKNKEVTLPNATPRSYAYCADTVYTESLAEKTKNVSLLYHETTYLKDLEERALKRFHSTTVQAATLAIKANANRLLIGHFSSKYEGLDEFLAETIEVFPKTELAIEGVSYRVL